MLMLGIVAIVMIPFVWVARRRMRQRGVLTPSPWIYLVAVCPGLLFVAFLNSTPRDSMFIASILLILAVVAFAALWVRELVHLMGLGDDVFPGRYDKVLWFAVLVCLPPIGVPAFAIFRREYWAAHKPVVDAAVRDMI